MQKSFPSCESVTIENSRAKFHWLYVCMMLVYTTYMCVCTFTNSFKFLFAVGSSARQGKQQAKVNNGTSNFTEISEFVIKRAKRAKTALHRLETVFE